MKSLAATDPTLLGPFQLLGVLGSGGMARVYLGESAAGRRVAIKVIWDNGARGARIAVTGSGNAIFLAGEESMSLVDISGRQLWFQPYPTYLSNAVPDWAGVADGLGYVTFKPTGDQRDSLDVDVIAVRLGTAA